MGVYLRPSLPSPSFCLRLIVLFSLTAAILSGDFASARLRNNHHADRTLNPKLSKSSKSSPHGKALKSIDSSDPLDSLDPLEPIGLLETLEDTEPSKTQKSSASGLNPLQLPKRLEPHKTPKTLPTNKRKRREAEAAAAEASGHGFPPDPSSPLAADLERLGEEAGFSTEAAIDPITYTLSVFILPPPPNHFLSLSLSSSSLSDPSLELPHRSIRSLIRMHPRPHVYLVGNCSVFHRLAQEFPRTVKQEMQVDFTLEGRPLLPSVVARALASPSQLALLVNADLLLVNETALKALVDRAFQTHPDGFLLTWPRFLLGDLPRVLAARPPSDHHVLADRLLRRHVAIYGRLQTASGAGAYLWSNDRSLLYNGSMPPFSVGRGRLDSWLAHATLVSSARAVVDGGTAVTCAALRRRKSGLLEGGREGGGREGLVLSGRRELWQVKAARRRRGRQLAMEAHEKESLEGRCPSRKPWMATPCKNGKENITVCLRQAICPCIPDNTSLEAEDATDPSEERNGTLPTESESSKERKNWLCNMVAPKPLLTAAAVNFASSPDRGFALEQLLPVMADERKIVILVAVSGGYADMLMNFVCTLRRLHIRDPLIAALDEDLYRFAAAQGLPVYLETFPEVQLLSKRDLKNVKEAKCIFGSNCFRSMTKLKSRAVLKILKLGYNVFWSDVDIAWFRDPIQEMYELGPHTFPVQCDEPNASIPANGRGFPTPFGTINSGFYFARSEPLVIKAFEAIIEHAAKREGQSEQPSFYKVLCGENQENLVGDEECAWNGLRVVFMSRQLHPNGRVFRLWNYGISRCLSMGCATLHNNWIKGKDLKIKRFKRRYIWWWDEDTRMCRYDWYSKMKGIVKSSY